MLKIKNQKGSFSFWLVFVILAFTTVTLFALTIPLLQNFLTHTYAAADDIITDANTTINSISDTTAKQAIQEAFTAQTESIQTNIDVLSVFFQYGWILVILVVVLALFILTRTTVEYEIR